ncbi:MAG: hypothetical protein M3R60_06985 [Pseudomonadota bacterium]|nr:hypothetical protein [Pseudomonadota bacterium]
MSNKFLMYAIFVTVVATWSSWAKLIGSASTRGGGSSWSSHSGGGGYYGGGGGGHK